MTQRRNLFKWNTLYVVSSICLLGMITSAFPWQDEIYGKITKPSGIQSSSTNVRPHSGRLVRSPTEHSEGDIPESPSHNSSENSTHHKKGNHAHGGVHVAEWRWEYVKTPFIYTAFVITAGLCKIGYHHADFLSSIVPESCLLIVLGTVVGSILYGTGSESLLPQFDSRTFFLFLLPPIVLESAYSLHDRAFFSNLGTILLYAVVGTLLNCFTIGLTLYGLYSVGAVGETLSLTLVECLVFSALISAVDPVAVLAIFQEVGVHKALYFLVFGESLLNDAVTVVLYTMLVALSTEEKISAGQLGLGIASFFCVSLGGLAIGILMGILTALVTKKTNNVRVVEPLAMLGVAYLAYLTAEMVHFSGIISIIGCGLVQAQYAWCNISQKSYTTVKYFSKMLSAVCDTVIFLFLGMVLVNDHHEFNVGFVLWTTLLCLLFRFIGVLCLTFITNNSFDRVRRINFEEQFIMAYGGLRGAVAFSLVIMLEEDTVHNKNMFVTTTLFIILFTVFIQGGTIKPLVNLLKIRLQTGHKHSLFEEINKKVVDSVMTGIEEITGSHGDNYWKHIAYKYDEKYFKKWLQRDCHDNALTRVYTKMVLADHFAHLYGPATVLEENQEIIAMRDPNCPEEEILSVKCLPKMYPPAEVIEMRRMSTQIQSPIKTSTSNLNNNKRRNTLVTPLSSFRRRGNTAPATDDPSKLLQKALQHNPYNKLHFKYNPNLVEDDHQELLTHLRARRLRARRLTLAAMNSLSSSTASSLEDIRSKSGTSEANTEARDTLCQKSASLINDQTINFMLGRASSRKSAMSSRRPDRFNRADTTKSENDAAMQSAADKRKANFSNSAGSDGKISFGSLDSIEEIRSEADAKPAAPKPTENLLPNKRVKKSLTFDVASLGPSEMLDLEEELKDTEM